LPPLLLSAAAAASLEKERMQPEEQGDQSAPVYARSNRWHAAATSFLVGQVDLMISASGARRPMRRIADHDRIIWMLK